MRYCCANPLCASLLFFYWSDYKKKHVSLDGTTSLMKRNLYTLSENAYPIRLQLLSIRLYLNRQTQLKLCDVHWLVFLYCFG
jgi:hypothetical protein